MVDGGNPAGAAAFGTSCAALADQFAHLVALSVTDFGTTGRTRRGGRTDPVLYAMSTALSRTGPTAGTPVLPPAGSHPRPPPCRPRGLRWPPTITGYVAAQENTSTLSRFEAVVQALDPPFGSEGQAAVGLKRSSELWRGGRATSRSTRYFACNERIRPDLPAVGRGSGVACARGSGEPEQFADPKFDTIAARYAASRELNARDRGSGRTRRRWTTWSPRVNVAEYRSPRCSRRRRRCPRSISALSGRWPMSNSHAGPACPFLSGHSWSTVSMSGYARPAPVGRRGRSRLGDKTFRRLVGERHGQAGRLTGMRILDLGVIVAGGELGRLFADLGAEVIKIESATYPDGLRQTPPGQVMSRSWALTHRNEYGLGLDLRHPSGAELFREAGRQRRRGVRQLQAGNACVAGVFLRTVARAQPAHRARREQRVRGHRPVERANGLRPTGPRHHRGHPAVDLRGCPAAAASMTPPRSSPITSSARITAIAALAAVIGRDHTGTGAHVHISQAEAAVNQLATRLCRRGRPRGARFRSPTTPQCMRSTRATATTKWCVISLRSDADRVALAAAMGRDALPRDRAELIAAVSEWTSSRDKTAVAEALQHAGVPAAPMNRAVDVLADPQITFRRVFSDMTHPLFDAPMPTETGPAPYLHIAPAELRPAPMPGEHTREICQKLLALDADEIERLIAEGALFTHQGRS